MKKIFITLSIFLIFTGTLFASTDTFNFENFHDGIKLEKVAEQLQVPLYNANKILSRGIGIKPLKAKGLFTKYNFSKIIFKFAEDNTLYQLILSYKRPNNQLKALGLIKALKSKYPSTRLENNSNIQVIFENKQMINEIINKYAEEYKKNFK